MPSFVPRDDVWLRFDVRGQSDDVCGLTMVALSFRDRQVTAVSRRRGSPYYK
jgi:hypothetical protein